MIQQEEDSPQALSDKVIKQLITISKSEHPQSKLAEIIETVEKSKPILKITKDNLYWCLGHYD
ncbi:MAG: hypothetical protein ACLRX9_02500 [Streptococcus salivarius]